MIGDYHMHTILCKHAVGSAPEYVRTAAEKGIGEVCFTDHAPSPHGYDPSNRMTLDQFPLYLRMLAEARDARSSVEVLSGIEADYYQGCEQFLADWLPRQDFDMVLGSVHYIGGWGIDDPDQLAVWKTADVPATWQRYFELVAEFARKGLVDVIAHLDLPKKFGHRLPPDDLMEFVAPALDAIADAGMGIEINTSGLRKPAAEIYPCSNLLRMAFERRIPICIGSDAHAPADVGSAFDKAVALARSCGYTHTVSFRKRTATPVPLPAECAR